jgi:hypothetical protein
MNREQMIAEAIDLAIEHKGNISNIALAKLIAEARGEPEPEFDAPAGPAVKPEEEEYEDEDVVETPVPQPKRSGAQAVYARKRLKIAAAKTAAMKTTVVTITSKDPRENEVSTTAFLSVENQHFSIGKSVPLDIPVELEQCLIDNARTCKIPMHKDEVKDGRRTGNKITIMVNKYVVSYSQRPQ